MKNYILLAVISIISIFTSCTDCKYSIVESTSTDSTVLDGARYIYTSNFHADGSTVTINGEKFRCSELITRNGKKLFRVANGIASVINKSPREIVYSSIIQSADLITISHLAQKDESFIIPEGFEGYSSFNNSLVVIDNVAIRGTGGTWAWFLMMVSIIIAISAIIFSVVTMEDSRVTAYIGFVVAGVMIYFAYYLYSIH